jgi:hypothetical protein
MEQSTLIIDCVTSWRKICSGKRHEPWQEIRERYEFDAFSRR